MNDIDEFKKSAYEFIDWIVEYYKNIESYPVKSGVKPKEIFNKIPDSPLQNKENINQIFSDFQNIILPGITHWQSPNFFAYFPANTSYPSLLATITPSVERITKLPAWSINTPTFNPSSPNKVINTGKPTKEVLQSPAVRINAPTVACVNENIFPRAINNNTEKPKTIYVTDNGKIMFFVITISGI